MIQITFPEEQDEQDFMDQWFMDRSQDRAPWKLKRFVEVKE